MTPGLPDDRRERARTGLRQVALGSGLLVLGLVITGGTLAAARPGGRYTLAYGPIVFGLVELVRGLIGWWPNREAALPPRRTVTVPPATSARTFAADRVARSVPPPTLSGASANPAVRDRPVVAPRVTSPAPTPPPATANDAERRRLSLSATTTHPVERPAAPWHRPTIGVRREADPITLLRFAAHRCEIRAEGLKASYPDGTTRDVAWSEIATIAVRQLPPDPPWERTLLVDLAPAGGPPVRILSTTFVNFAALPGGASATRLDNIRGLTRLVQERNPHTAIEEGTAPALRPGGTPLRLLSMNQFGEYDARYG